MEIIQEIIHGDCLVEMKNIPNKSVDMVLCDLPYGTTRNKWDSVIDLVELWEQYERIIKDNGVIVLFAQTPFDKLLGVSNIKLLKYEWIWEKSQGTGHLNAKKMPMKNHENILIFYKNLPTYNPQMVGFEKRKIRRSGLKSKTTNYGEFVEIFESDYIGRYPLSIQKFKNEHGLHPTQKPVPLFEYLIKTYSNEGDLVLDNAAGSGTTGVACKNLNRQFILIEKEEEYIKIIKERLS